MTTVFHTDEIKQLKNFRLSEQPYPSELSIAVSDLLDKEKLTSYLSKLQETIDAPDQKVTASMLVKRYGFFAVLSLYSMTILNKQLNVSLNNVFIETDENKEISVWLPNFRLQNLECCVAEDNRMGWRDKYLKSLFSEHIQVIIDVLSRETKISKLILWENIAIYIYWLYEMLLEEERFDMYKTIIEDDFNYVVGNANGYLFGPDNRNPLSRYFSKKTYHTEHDKEIRVRKTCCLYYQTTSQNDHCLTCPLTCKKA